MSVGIDSGQGDHPGAPASRRRRIEHPGAWDPNTAQENILDDIDAIKRVTGTNETLDNATLAKMLMRDRFDHAARIKAYEREMERRQDEDAEQSKADERAKAMAEAEVLCAPFDTNYEMGPTVGELYFPYIHVSNLSASKEEKIGIWKETLTGIIKGICPALCSAYADRTDALVANNKVFLDLLFLAGPVIFGRLIDEPKENRASADAFYVYSVTLVLALIKGDNHLNANRVYTEVTVARSEVAPTFTPGTSILAHFVRYKEHHNAVFALAVSEYDDLVGDEA